ncbi:MAG: hypothetical protein U0903_04040 [Planctomycetales bacterium]
MSPRIFLRFTDATEQVTTTQWSNNGLRQEVIDAQGNKTVMDHDAAGHVIRITGPTGQTVRFTFDSLGRMTTLVDAGGKTTRVEYQDDSELIAARIDVDGVKQEFNYDRHGSLTEIRRGGGKCRKSPTIPMVVKSRRGPPGRPEVKYTYDAKGKSCVDRRSTGAADPHGYDPHGNLSRVTNPLGGVTRWTYDSANRIVSKTDASDAAVKYEVQFAR